MPKAVYALGLGIFALVTSELQTTAMMPTMAADLQVSISLVGYLVTLYALAMAVGGPLLTAALLKLPYRDALLILVGFFVVGEVLGAIAPGYEVLLIARIITGAVSGAFFGVAIAVAVELAAPSARGRATSIVLAGLMVGTVLGLPLANFIGTHIGWRTSFWSVAALAVVVGFVITVTVPRMSASGGPGLREEIELFRSPRLWAVFSTSTLIIGATYAAFSYFTPILRFETDFSPNAVTGLLVVYGAATLIGNYVVGRLADSHTIGTLLVGLLALLTLLVVFGLVAGSKIPTVVVLVGIGLVGVTMNPAMVARVMKTANGRPLVNTVHTSCITLGVVLGSWAGGLGIGMGYGLRAPLWVGAVLAVAGLLTLLPDALRYRGSVPSIALDDEKTTEEA